MTKICKTCAVEKTADNFYVHNTTKDRLNQNCKSCILYKRYGKYSQTPRIKSTSTAYDYKMDYTKKYPEKYKANYLSQRVKKLGFDKHHWSYNIEHAKDIIWINPKDHNYIHLHIKYDQSFFMYRDTEGHLLDTKEKHELFINKLLDRK